MLKMQCHVLQAKVFLMQYWNLCILTNLQEMNKFMLACLCGWVCYPRTSWTQKRSGLSDRAWLFYLFLLSIIVKKHN